MEFQYKAIRNNGEMVEGVFIADTRSEVVSMLKQNGSYPVEVEEKKRIGTKEIQFKRGVKSKDLSFFCRQLNAMLTAGSTITKSLDIMKKQIPNLTLRETVEIMSEDVQKGKVLSESMKQFPRVFPEMMIYMVESGEIGGTLDKILYRLADYFEKDAKLKNKVKSAMIYPMMLMVVSIGVVIFMVTFILPTFVSMFEKSGVELPAITQFMVNLSKFMKSNGVLVIVVFVIIALLIYQYINSDSGRYQFDKLKLKLPIVKGVTKNIMTARFARNLSTMLASGVPLLTALKNLSNIMNNKVIAEAILGFRENVQKGYDLHMEVRESKLFPPMLDGMMEIGKESGTLDDILDKTADYYDEEVDTSLSKLVTMFEPMMILMLAGIVGFIVISMALPMFDMFQTIQ